MITDVPGVYQEWLPRRSQPGEYLNFEAVIVTAYTPKKYKGSSDVIACAWRISPDRPWHVAQGFFNSEHLRPHPDPDRAWADYCAAELTGCLSVVAPGRRSYFGVIKPSPRARSRATSCGQLTCNIV